MSTKNITLFVITEDEQNSWLKKLTYNAFSPRHDNPVDLIQANQVAKKSIELKHGTRIQVSCEATVSDVLAEARRSMSDYGDDFKVIKIKKGQSYGYPIDYHLYNSALGYKLDNTMKISELGLTDTDLVIIRKCLRDHDPSWAPMTLSGVSSWRNFQNMVWGSENPNDPMLLATMLYTDEDVELARYVREHFDEIHRMSGPRVIVYVVEHPPKDSINAGPLFWKLFLEKSVYRAWALLGWTQSRPYSKAAAYEIAYSLGIYPDQLPCLAVFDRTGQEEKIVFPMKGDFTQFFRKTFANIQHAIFLGPDRDIWDEEKRNNVRRMLFDRIRETLCPIKLNANDQYAVYNFYDQTVFINHPSGIIHLKDFQNTHKDIEEKTNG